MDLKNILVCLDATEAGQRRLRLAAAIARQHHAHLSAAYILPANDPGSVERGVVAAAPHPPGSGSEAAHGPELPEIIEQRFRDAVGPQPPAGDWHLFTAGEGDGLAALLRVFDLAIFGQTAPDRRVPHGFRPEDVVIASGRPLLTVPYAGSFDAIGRRVIVAWDGTREASRALHDALPLIGNAETVTVVRVRSREAGVAADPTLDRVVRHLQRHGIDARAEDTVGGGIPISDLLLSRAADLDADLMIAGAYHHSQFREALLGGVSRELLDHMTVPVLMSH